jgi:deferrochelatase/peroxidase EfeB
MTRFFNDALDAAICHGDLSLQICANTQDTTIHALRDIIKAIPDQLVLRWKQEGNVPATPPNADGTIPSARNFLGFLDGSANPDSNDDALMEKLVWITESRQEPGWATGGTYQVVRIIRNFVERWDRAALREQERIIGRRKTSGAPLDGGETERDEPDFAGDPDGLATPLDAHIRLAIHVPRKHKKTSCCAVASTTRMA